MDRGIGQERPELVLVIDRLDELRFVATTEPEREWAISGDLTARLPDIAESWRHLLALWPTLWLGAPDLGVVLGSGFEPLADVFELSAGGDLGRLLHELEGGLGIHDLVGRYFMEHPHGRLGYIDGAHGFETTRADGTVVMIGSIEGSV